MADIHHRVEIRRLSGRSQYTAHAPFKFVDFRRNSITGGVCEARVEISVLFEVKKVRHFLGGGIFESRALINRKYPWLTILRFPTALNTYCVEILFHISEIFSIQNLTNIMIFFGRSDF